MSVQIWNVLFIISLILVNVKAATPAMNKIKEIINKTFHICTDILITSLS